MIHDIGEQDGISYIAMELVRGDKLSTSIQNGQLAAVTGSMEKAAVLGALSLYLDFINLFLFFLRLFGGGRN